MGTVGLSFGSPTSGTGFDVSSTVAAIVSNLQKVETPWKTQLTVLESQDTAISTLGTLLSNLSNDLSQLTDFSGVMAQKTGSSSDPNVLELTGATSSAMAGTHTVVVNSLAKTSSGYMTMITNANDTLTGSITLSVGSGTARTISLPSDGSGTLASLAAAINASGAGVTASVLTDSSGSRLSLVSGTSGAGGNISVTANSIMDGSTSLAYTSTATGSDASLTVDGVGLTSASNTVSNLIPGLSFQLLSTSPTQSDETPEPVQVVIGNNNTAVESTVYSFVTDYNSLISAVNAQQGNDSSGNPEPLFGSPTLSLLQQQLLSAVNQSNPNGFLTTITENSSTALTGSMTIQVGNGTTQTVVVGAAPSSPAANTIYTGSGTTNLEGLAQAINAAGIGVTASVVTKNGQSNLMLQSQTTGSAGALGVSTDLAATSATALDSSSVASANSYGNLDTIPSGDTLSGSITIQTGSGTAQTVTLDSSDNTLQGLADAINRTAGIGVTASVTTSNGQSTLTLQSQTEGSAGNLAVTSNLQDTASATALGFSSVASTNAYSNVGTIPGAGDTLSGSITIQVGSGAAQTINVGDSSTPATLDGMAQAINNAGIGVTAAVVTNDDGSAYLSLTSQTDGSAGNLTVTSNLLDTTNTVTTDLTYTNSSDISTLANLDITTSQKYDGTLSFDATTLDSVLNSDFSSVCGFFQDLNSWGTDFANVLQHAGTSSTTGMLSLAAKANSNNESTLNAQISRQEARISAQQVSLMAELTSANQIMQALPTQLKGIDEMYSAISGYNQNS